MSAEDPAKTAVDPSMDDILASIRRILTEEDTGPALDVEHDALSGNDPLDDDVFDLSEAMLVRPNLPVAAPTPEPVQAPEPEFMVSLEDTAPPRLETPKPIAPPPPPPLPAADTLIGAQTLAETTASLGELVRTLQADRNAAVYRAGPTIEDVVRAEIRPILKDWLDTHLPGMVERIVRSEIERLAGRAVG